MARRALTHLLYGESGTFKTSQAGIFAWWVWKTFRKKTRLVSADGGGWAPIQKFIDAGIVDAFSVAKLDLLKHSPLSLLRKLAKGEWPRDNHDGTAKMVPTPPENWKDIGAYVVEGLTSFGELLMEELRVRQQRIGEDAVGSFSIDGERFAANCRSHYSFVQGEVAGLIKAFSSLPLEHLLITALEGRGEDEATRESIRGPGIVGKAATARVPSRVGDVIHADAFTEVKVTDPSAKFTAVQQQTKVRMWFVRRSRPFPTVWKWRSTMPQPGTSVSSCPSR